MFAEKCGWSLTCAFHVSLSLILRNITLSGATHSKSCILDESQYLMTPFPFSKLVLVFNENFSCERIIEIYKLQIMRNAYLM